MRSVVDTTHIRRKLEEVLYGSLNILGCFAVHITACLAVGHKIVRDAGNNPNMMMFMSS